METDTRRAIAALAEMIATCPHDRTHAVIVGRRMASECRACGTVTAEQYGAPATHGR